MSFSSAAFFAGHAKECSVEDGQRESERKSGSGTVGGSGWSRLADCDSCAAAGQCRCECASSLIMTLITLRPRPPPPSPRPLTNSPSDGLSVHLPACLSVRPSVCQSAAAYNNARLKTVTNYKQNGK